MCCSTHCDSSPGACSSDINVFCVDVQPGASRLEDCLTQQLAEEAKDGYTGNKVSAKCVKELDDFKIDRATNINKNVPLCMCGWCAVGAHSHVVTTCWMHKQQHVCAYMCTIGLLITYTHTSCMHPHAHHSQSMQGGCRKVVQNCHVE